MGESRRQRRARSVRCRVLVVEDDDVFAETLRELLEVDGSIEVVGRASNGQEGIDLVDELEPDIVLMDVLLPVLDGIEATRAIREKHPSLPVIALTGLEYEERALEVLEAGADEFLRKGRLEADLVETVVAAAQGRPVESRRQGAD